MSKLEFEVRPSWTDPVPQEPTGRVSVRTIFVAIDYRRVPSQQSSRRCQAFVNVRGCLLRNAWWWHNCIRPVSHILPG
jgi:hypothetical protein